MGTYVWLKDDIRNILISAHVTSTRMAQCAPSAGMLLYLRGYEAALTAVALACGIPPEQVAFSPAEAEAGRQSTDLSRRLLFETNAQPRPFALELTASGEHFQAE
jgi:hypothetical protein